MRIVMNTILTQEEEQNLRKHFARRVDTKYKPKTMNAIIAKVNEIRIGQASINDWVNNSTKIVTWGVYIELWSLFGRYVSWDAE